MGKIHPIQKPWGYVFRLPMPSGAEVHIATIKAGGTSSWHAHQEMVNVFFVISGKLRLKQSTGKTILLGSGDCLTVETGNFHQFEALADTVLVEGYGRVDINRSRVT